MLLSIIIPVYNVEKYIIRCLDSIYALSIKEELFEILCVDDCSSDNSVEIIEGYQKQHSNIQLLRHEHNGKQGAARNTGIRHIKGEYCMFVDADDTLPQMDLLALVEYIRSHDLELLLGKANVIAINGSSNWGNAPEVASRIMSGPDIYVDEFIHKIAFGVVWLAIYKTALVKRVPPFFENVQYEDTDWTLRCAYEAQSLQYCPIVLYNYHVNTSTTTTTKSIRSLIEKTKQSLRIYNWAQTTIVRHDEVVFAAEDYGTWNLRGLSALIQYDFKERSKFYRSFQLEDLKAIAHWKGGNYTKLYVRFPFLSQIALCFLHPVYIIYRKAKMFLNK